VRSFIDIQRDTSCTNGQVRDIQTSSSH